jgi:hypothetical protein
MATTPPVLDAQGRAGFTVETAGQTTKYTKHTKNEWLTTVEGREPQVAGWESPRKLLKLSQIAAEQKPGPASRIEGRWPHVES